MPKRSKKTLRQKLAEVIEETSNDGNPRWNCKGNMEEELPCAYFQEKNFSPGNFKRHILNKHANIAGGLELEEPEEEKDASEPTPKKVQPDKVITKLTLEIFIVSKQKTPYCKRCAVGWNRHLSSPCLPLSFPEWEATKYTLKPLWDAAKLTVTRNTLPELIKKAAKNMREIMSTEFKNKIICLKIDAASRNGRSVLGINAQFIDDAGNIQIRHIAVHEMPERQTKENLKTVIESELQKLAVLWAQILAIAHDNGANMCACVRLINSILRKLVGIELPQTSLVEQPSNALEEQPSNDEEDEEEDESGHDEEDDSNDAEIVDDFCDEVDNLEKPNTTDEGDDEEFDLMLDSIQSVRCSVRQLFTGYKVPLPPKVVETRWNVWYIVLSYLKALMTSPLYPVLLAQDATLDLTKHTPFINQFIEAFEPMFQLTNRLQKDHVPLTDFYSLWLVCQGHQHRIASTGNVLAKKLLAAMEARIGKMKATSLFKACLLLDPRYNFKGANRLTGTDKTEAKRYLLSLNQKLEELNGNRSKEEDLERTEETNPLANVSAFIEDYVAGLFDEDAAPPSTSEKVKSPIDILNQLECRDKVCLNTTPWTVNGEPTHKGKPFSIIEYWKSKRLHNPLCYKLAMVIYSAPSTQVTVERLFSHLKHMEPSPIQNMVPKFVRISITT